MKRSASHFARRLAAVGISAALLLPVIGVAPVAANTAGCTPGYWKNHTDNWPVAVTMKFANVPGFVFASAYEETRLIDALQGGGGSGDAGAIKILLRAAAAAYLNSLAFPGQAMTQAAVFDWTNWAMSSTREDMLYAAWWMDNNNNVGCPY